MLRGPCQVVLLIRVLRVHPPIYGEPVLVQLRRTRTAPEDITSDGAPGIVQQGKRHQRDGGPLWCDLSAKPRMLGIVYSSKELVVAPVPAPRRLRFLWTAAEDSQQAPLLRTVYGPGLVGLPCGCRRVARDGYMVDSWSRSDSALHRQGSPLQGQTARKSGVDLPLRRRSTSNSQLHNERPNVSDVLVQAMVPYTSRSIRSSAMRA